jgi:hypothetical protein
MMQQWEYLDIHVPAEDTTDLNELGSQGWELVTALPLPPDYLFCIFKRPTFPKEFHADDDTRWR